MSEKPIEAERMAYTFGVGGPRALDALVNAKELVVDINGPGEYVSKLHLLTSLSYGDGLTEENLQGLAQELEVVAECGHSDAQLVKAELTRGPLGPSLQFDVGPHGMYQNELVIRSRTARSLREAITHHLARGTRHDFIAVLVPQEGEEQEHNHGHHGHQGHQP